VDGDSGKAVAIAAGQVIVYHNGTIRTHTLVTVIQTSRITIGQSREGVLRADGPSVHIPVSFSGTHGVQLDTTDSDVNHHVIFDCIVDNRFATAVSTTVSNNQYCILTFARPDIDALRSVCYCVAVVFMNHRQRLWIRYC